MLTTGATAPPFVLPGTDGDTITQYRLTDYTDYDVCYDELDHHPNVAKRAIFASDDTRTIRYTWGTDDAYERPDIETLETSIAWLRETGDSSERSSQHP